MNVSLFAFENGKELTRCLVPENYGIKHKEEKEFKEKLWDKYYTLMPEQRRQCVERCIPLINELLQRKGKRKYWI